MDQSRLLLAFGISLLILVLYQEVVLKRYRQPPSDETEAPVAQEPVLPLPVPETMVAANGLAAPSAGEAVQVETDVFRIAITPTGARLAALELKDYRRTVGVESPPLELVQGAPVLPLTLQLGADASDAEFAYRADRSSLTLRGDERGQLVFVAEHEGRQVEKRYSFTGAAYDFELATRISDPNPPPSVSLVLTAMPEGESRSGTEEVALAFVGKRLVQKPMGELRNAPVPVEGTATWAGFAAQYFLIAAVAGNDGARAIMTTAAGLPLVQVEEPLVSGRATFTLYAGPKEREKLAEVGHDLGRALDFGWFWFVAIPLLQALRALQRLTGNYGVAIILLTTLVKVATIPLTQTTFRNMREMQKIQPQMKKLQEKFKDDRVALQREMMELYRRHRVNPLSGCLPMVLQLPIFVGLYNALMHAIELRHAPFVLWIDDLSAPDRLMVAGVGVPVLTLLMGASMLLQQRLTPAQGDPMQQRMMMFMPLVFTFMFINFPAGLVLYWLVNNVLSIGHQYVVMRPTKRGSTS